MTTTKILLLENENSYNEIISNSKTAYSNGQTLLSKLAKLGLTLSKVENWEAIELEFKKDYPKATIQFNIDANGITEQYREAEAFYVKHRHALRFEPLTQIEIEQIRESQRIYTTNENQVRAIELFNTIKDSLLELKNMGVPMDLNKTYLINRVLIGDDRLSLALKVDPSALYNTVINLK
nr:hypothetical protein [Flavobacterium sp.]